MAAGISSPVNRRGIDRPPATRIRQAAGPGIRPCPEVRCFASGLCSLPGSGPLPDPADEGFDAGKNALNDPLDPLRRRMRPVGEVESLLAGDPIQEERVEHEVVGSGEVAIDPLEASAVFGAKI